MGGNRGDVDIEGNQFLELYEAEQDIQRVFAPLELIRPEDFIIDDGAAYAITVLKDFFKNKKVPIEDENEVLGEIQALRAV